MDCSLPGSSVDGESPGEDTGVGCHFLLQRIFPTQGSNPGLPHYGQMLYCLSHQGIHQVRWGTGVDIWPEWASLVAPLVKKPPAMRETWVLSLGWEDPLEKGKATHSSIS